MIAQFVTVWDGGTVISTGCWYDAKNRLVSDILTVDAPDVDSLDRTYIELPNGEQITSFYDEDNAVAYEDGQPSDMDMG